MNQFSFDKSKIPSYASKVARILINEGFDCYLVGGAVRDNLLGKKIKDFDFTSNATPEQLIKLDSFPKSVQINERFGTIAVIVNDDFGENHSVEITTYRAEEAYVGGRWPSIVKFGVTLFEDLARRDFTYNALAVDMKSVFFDDAEIKIIDNFGGLEDLKSNLVRAVGVPFDRFSEDGLRSIRAIRFASNLGHTIESETYAAIRDTLHITKQVSIERFRDEFNKIILNSPTPSIGIELLRNTGVLELFIPELLEGINITQKLFHVHNVYEHNLSCLDEADDRVKLAALFHDIGKPRCDTKDGHFYGHDQVGAEMTKEILTRLKYPNDVILKNYKLIANHMFYFPEENNWSDGAIRRFISRVGVENLEELFMLRIADAVCNPKNSWDSSEIVRLQSRVSDILMKDNAFKVTDLDISGIDLLGLGLNGKEVGDMLKKLLEDVVEEPSLNSNEKLKELAKSYIEKKQ
jgi:tRNA nucleotidyltransferase (CCA-adding enzyme)